MDKKMIKYSVLWLHFYCVVCSDLPTICPNIISKSGWNGLPATHQDYVKIPVENIIIHHTVSEECYSLEECATSLRNIQSFHMDELEFHDMGYNFLIGSDGNVYEGAGWHKIAAHTRGYNSRSLGIAFVGNFSSKVPSEKMLNALRKFLECGVKLGEIDQEYKLFGGRQVSATSSPGAKLFKEIKTWPHLTNSP
ncbi:peptidoglycan-recognition protein 2-like isoform X1 [Sitophilus oryzae]|uniref:Peptidoglycan-recognition protein n=1 Tax=Sitophilus oryzae TaxID=7048 RepID=A0A6J2YAZ6_SITOR|nr:peptidoglycan-recognition protein 2-like isoform X1 [Sitophilus oryzae]